MNNDVLISIIVPVYNVSNYLKECLVSIINQSFKNIEIICVNDGSTDDSLEILESFQKMDKRIKIINQINKGLSAARNTGLDIAKGKYIGFVDSDDYIHPDMYKMLYDAIEKYDVDISVCNYTSIEKGEFVSKSFTEDCLIDSRDDYIREVLLDTKIQNYVWTRLYKRELFDNVRFPVGFLFEDVSVSTQLLNKINKAYYISKPLYYYRIREGSITSTISLSTIDDSIYNAYERYLKIKKDFSELNDINVYSMLVWLYYQFICFRVLTEESFYKVYREIFDELVNDNNIKLLEKYSELGDYHNAFKLINEYKKYIESDNNTITEIDMNEFNELLETFDEYFYKDKDKLQTLLRELREKSVNYDMFMKYKNKLATYINQYGRI